MAVYRAGRVETLRVLDEIFERPRDFDLVRYWEEWSADFESSLPTVAVAVRASPTAIAVMPEILGAAVRPALDAAEPADGEGWRRLVLTFEHEDAAAFRLAGFGGGIEVVSPESVRTRLVVAAQATLQRYAT
jgi:predicted DNA-binding transcriptional regulator YafY